MTQTFFNKLPNGLHLVQNLDGTASIIGIPDDLPGYYKFKLRCEDTDGNIATKEFEIAIGNIVSLLHFDAPNGTTSITDETGKSWTRRGTVSNISTTESKFGGSSLFISSTNGNNGFFTAHDNDLNIDEPLSISCWSRLNITLTGSPFYPVFDKTENIINPTSGFRSNIAQKPVNTSIYNYNATIASTSVKGATIYGPEPEPLQWQYLHYDFTPNSIRMQVNDEKTDSVYILPPTDNTLPLHIGGSSYGGTYMFPGYIDEFKVVKGVKYLNANYPIPTGPSDYPQPPLELSINGYLPNGAAHAPYSSTTNVSITGTGPFTAEISDGTLPGDWELIVNDTHVEITGTTPLPPDYYTFTIRVSDGVNIAELPVSLFMKEYQWQIGEETNTIIPIKQGVPPYSNLSIYSGTPLPSGLSASIIDNNIVITGTPDDEIEYGYIEFTVTDNESETIIVNVGYVIISKWTPLDLDNIPQVYLSHESSITSVGTKCSVWNNLGSLSNYVQQTTDSRRPEIITDGPNNRRVLRFNGSSTNMRDQIATWGHMFTGVSNGYMFAVYKPIGTRNPLVRELIAGATVDNGRIRLGIHNDHSDTSYPLLTINRTSFQSSVSALGTVLHPVDQWIICCGTQDWSNSVTNLYGNGISNGSWSGLLSAGVPEDTTNRFFHIGSSGAATPTNSWALADIACVISSNTALTDTDRQLLEGWAAWEYGLQSNLPSDHPYKNSPRLFYPYIQLKGKLPVWVIGSEVSGQFKITGGSGVYTGVALASGSTLPPNVIMAFDDNDTITFSGIVNIDELSDIHTITLDITDTISTKQATFKVKVDISNEIDLIDLIDCGTVLDTSNNLINCGIIIYEEYYDVLNCGTI